jgi:ATP-dependent 26S proteasome regulatory subunit
MLAKIIVSHNECEFYVYGGIRVCAEVPREGPILVLDVFRLAMENTPGIECINDINAMANTRVDVQIGADRDVQQGGTAYPF